MRNALRWAMLLCAVTTVAGAQSTPQLVAPATVNAGVKYPLMLRYANVWGEVIADLEIDSTGKATIASVRSSTHDLFKAAVRSAVPSWRFTPAQSDGKPVTSHLELDVRFHLPADSHTPREEIARVVQGVFKLSVDIGWVPIAREQIAERQSDAEIVAITSEAVQVLIPRTAADSGRAVCIAVSDSLANRVWPATFRAVLAKRPFVKGMSDCPPTYTTMFQLVDSLGNPVPRPKGAIDPVIVSVKRLDRWTRDVYVIDADVTIGTGTDIYTCQAGRSEDASRSWGVHCESTGFRISDVTNSLYSARVRPVQREYR